MDTSKKRELSFKHIKLIKFIKDNEDEDIRVLDVAGGDGIVISEIPAKYKAIIDNDIDGMYHNCDLKNKFFGDVTKKMPFQDNEFDVCIFSEVLEHLEPDTYEDSFKEINRILKEGGRLYLTTPNKTKLRTLKFILQGKNIKSDRTNEKRLVCTYHTKEFNIKSVLKMARKHNLIPEIITGISFVGTMRIRKLDFIGEWFPSLSAKMLIKFKNVKTKTKTKM